MPLASLMAFIFIKSFALMDCYKMHSCSLQSPPNDSHSTDNFEYQAKEKEGSWGAGAVGMSENFLNRRSTYFCP